MTFNSWVYILALLVVVPLYWWLPQRQRIPYLVLVNILAYSLWRWEFTFLLLFSTTVDYICALLVHRSENQAFRRLCVVITLFINLGLLAFFKYTYFFVDNLGWLAGAMGGESFTPQSLGLSIILPLGISFYTFHSISYTIDVYRRQISPTTSYITFLTFVTFWPQLVAGPILRASEVIPQLLAARRVDWTMVSSGIGLIIVGLFKKVVIADSLAPYSDFWFTRDASLLTAIDAWGAAFTFGFQIYFDFSGYSDIAIGSALLMGIVFPDNFNWPYMSTSPRDFWQRWHISLSSWIRDYLYLPLTGQRFRGASTGGIGVAMEGNAEVVRSRTLALFLTWTIMGLWHGSAWTFVLWGLYHSMTIWLYRAVKPLNWLVERNAVIGWCLTLPVAMAGWIFFRATSVSQALTMFGKILDPTQYYLSPMITGLTEPKAGWSLLICGLILVAMTLIYQVQRTPRLAELPSWIAAPFRCTYLAAMVFFVILFMEQKNQFIYFQF